MADPSKKTNIKQNIDCSDICITLVNNRLTNMIEKDFAINGKLLMEQLKPNKILITGGIIPAAINGTNDYGDLDIVCCDIESFKHFTDFINSLLHVDQKCHTGSYNLYFGKEHIQKVSNYDKIPNIKKPGDTAYCISEKKQEIEKYCHDYHHVLNWPNVDLVHRLRGLALIDSVVNYIVNGKCLQIIILKEKENNIKNYIKEFDLDICRNYFDGEGFYCENIYAIKEKQMTLYRYKYKNGEIADSLLDERSIERLEKYKKRGYVLIREVYDYIE
jgi:hypothetical protein